MASEARTKHDEQFERLALVHLDNVYRLSRRLAGNTHEAEDLVQETFIRAYRAYGNFENRDGTALPWLMKICHNVFYSRLNKSSREPINLESTEGLGRAYHRNCGSGGDCAGASLSACPLTHVATRRQLHHAVRK